MIDIDLVYLFKILLTFLINTTVSFLLLIILLYILIMNNKHTVYQQRLLFSFYFFSLLLLVLVTVANSSPIPDKYNHLILPKYPNDKNYEDTSNIVSNMRNIMNENLFRNLYTGNHIESEADFYYKYESSCFEYISTFFPFNPETGKTRMHNQNSFNNTKIFDDDIWKIPFPKMNNESKIVYVGGYEEAETADLLYDLYQSHILIFEPVSTFYNQLLWNKIHAEENRNKAAKFSIINKGLGSSSKKLIVNKSNILADGTSFVKKKLYDCNETTDSTECIYIEIENVAESLKSLHLDKLNDVSLFHINCEGCEFEVLESLIEHDMLKNIPSLVMHTHYADYLEEEIDYVLIERYCRIQYELSKLFKPIYGFPFVLERWDRDDDQIVSLQFSVTLPDTAFDFTFRMRRDLVFAEKKAEKNQDIAKYMKSFCDNNNIESYFCYQIWEKVVQDINKLSN